MLGLITIMLGALADLIGRNRQLLEQTLERVRMVEEKLDERGEPRESKLRAIPGRKESAARSLAQPARLSHQPAERR